MLTQIHFHTQATHIIASRRVTERLQAHCKYFIILEATQTRRSRSVFNEHVLQAFCCDKNPVLAMNNDCKIVVVNEHRDLVKVATGPSFGGMTIRI